MKTSAMNELILISISKTELDDLITESVRKCLFEYSSSTASFPNLKFQGNTLNEFMTIEDLSASINMPKPTIYALCSKGKIPHIKKAKRLLFSKTDIVLWLNEGKRKTQEQLQSESVDSLSVFKKCRK
ncbi:helix-turn-helix domain-containing protein [Mucilaginibacter sp.]